MNETTRLFVGNLEKGVTEAEIHDAFSYYGKIAATDIKSKKDAYNGEHQSFAFVTLEAKPWRIDECISAFSNEKWTVTRARESFMDKLKREREEARKSTKRPEDAQVTKVEPGARKTPVLKKMKLDSSSDGESDEPGDAQVTKVETVARKTPILKKLKPDSSSDEESDEPGETVKKTNNVIKNGIILKADAIKPSVLTVEAKEPMNEKLASSHNKRIQSMKDMRNTYQLKKTAIQQSLSNIDKNPTKKIKFNSDSEGDDKNTSYNKRKRRMKSKDNNLESKQKAKSLFDRDTDEESIDNSNIDFKIREQFEGSKGQQLLELQSRYQSDKRFVLDDRFVDGENERNTKEAKSDNGDIELASEDEKSRNLNMLKDILGVEVTKPKRDANEDNSLKRKNMIRFDPMRPEHEKFMQPKSAQTHDEPKKSKKERRKEREQLRLAREQERDERQANAVQVSQKTFYNVNVSFAKPAEENAPFSLLNMFGKADDADGEKQFGDQYEYSTLAFNKATKKNRNPLDHDPKNPFKYDSSDSEDEKDGDPVKTDENKAEALSNGNGLTQYHTFFFLKNDKRLKEGLEFFADTSSVHQKMRREMKVIVKKRLSNNERKNSKKLFNKKIGGGRRQQYGNNARPRRLK